MGFADSFVEAANKTAPVGAAGALDLIKEKIKKEQTKAEEKYKATTFMNSTMSIASQLPDQDMAKKIIGIAEAAGNSSSDVQKNINEMVLKQFAPKDPALQAVREDSLNLRKDNRQDKLEKFHTDRLTKVLSNRTGGLGLQDAKVNQALDLRVMVDGMKDPDSGEYKIPPSAHTELALGVAKLLSPTGVVAQQLVDKLEQGTLAQKMANVAITFGADPKEVGGTTQSVTKFMIKTIDRQGELAETIRNKYIEGLKKTAPRGLDPARIDELNNIEMGSSFKEYLKQNSSSSQQFNVGGKIYNIPADQVDAFKKAKGIS